MEELADCCVKVYTLEKVLLLKKDTLTQTNFMDEAMKVCIISISRTPNSIVHLRFLRIDLAQHSGMSLLRPSRNKARKR